MLEAKKGLSEGGIPIGSVLVDQESGEVVSRGHNLRVQQGEDEMSSLLVYSGMCRVKWPRHAGDPTAHAEVVAVRNAGRRTDWHRLVLVSTLR